ncbi:hypothetical protein NHX12_033234 [Muraenolepis orangiensis]|uniref:Protein AATF n=1 Tax=Muraenolepis orangiensis TaxID=630683 RepID=A0A9Q0E309_9TELE|nr:hypothetical protein NHX12_033234 [Muraenolepis orangiensis]
MAGSVSQQLEELLNPLPKFADPENDQDDETKAQVDDRFDEDDNDDVDDGGFGLSNLRKHNTSLLAETDRRYVGRAVSRKQLLKDMGGSEEEEEDDDDEDKMTEAKGEDDDDDDQESGDECDDIESADETEKQNAPLANGSVNPLASKKDVVCAKKVDFHKLTEGMDDLGESDEDDESDDDDGEEDDDDSEEGMEDEDEEQGTVKTFSKEKVDEEVEKGKAVKNQLILWDQLLEGRIKVQKALVTANQLPQPQTFPEFKQQGGEEFAGALKNSHKALKALQRSLLELQDQLLHQNPDTRPISLGKTYGVAANGGDEELSDEMEVDPAVGSGAQKRKLDVGQYPGFMAKRFADFQPYCTGTLQKWHDKTRLTTGKSSKGFSAFERNIVTQVEQVLLDKERLLRRTQTRRTEYRVLGKNETASSAAPDDEADGDEAVSAEERQLTKANRHLKDLDEDIFDDDDFYHQLLRELIERKTSAADPNDQVAMGRQWLAIQKLRSKIKKRVDTKASKGRKVRFTIHSKLVNFMAPVDHGAMNHEARTELFRCLFGNNSPLEGSQVNVV